MNRGSADYFLDPQEYAGLKALYDSTNGKNWKWKPNVKRDGLVWNFTSNSDPCYNHWQGVYCYGAYPCRNCSLFTINLVNYGLVGELPPQMNNFKKLLLLDLSVNSLTGQIPSMQSLQSLYLLNLSFNSLDQTINPDLGTLKAMEYLYLSNNSLKGPIPNTLYNLTDISVLSLRDNELSGTIPSGISSLQKLKFLHLGNNYLTGTIPDELGLLKNLEYLYVNNNQLVGKIPTSVSALANLTVLSMQDNLLTSTVPEGLSALQNLTQLSLNGNLLTGTVPTSLSRLRYLQILQLQSNQLHGSIDGVFSPATQLALENIDLSDNAFSGSIPVDLFKLPSLLTVAASKNCFSGFLPSEICNSQHLNVLLFDGLSSAAPCLHYLWDPLHITVGYFANPMQGHIPSCIWNLQNLTTLHLSGNLLSGGIPPVSVGSVPSKLAYLSLAYNRLTGTIPDGLQNFGFSNIDLSHNKLQGSIAQMCSAGCSTSQNNVPSSGGVPQIILDVNRLSGSLPSAFNDMYGINVLDGNVFECADGYGSRGLPKYDPSSDTYICGADEFNRAMISVASIFSLVGLILIAVLLLGGQFSHLLDKYPKVKKLLLHLRLEFSLLQEFITTAAMFSRASNAPIQPVGDKYKNILEFVDSFTLLRNVCIKVLLFSVLVCLPVYIMFYTFTDKFSTHRDKYGWISTSVFLTGDIPAAILSLLWLSCCLFVVTMIARRYYQESIDWGEVYQRIVTLFSLRDGSQYEYADSEDTSSTLDQPLPVSVDRDESNDTQTLNSSLNSSSYSKKSMASVAKDKAIHYSYILLVFVLNVALSMAVNSVYVSIQSSDTVSSSSKILCQVAMAGVKLFINMVVVKALIAHIPFCKSKARLHVAMVVFNSVVAPCLATALSDSSCFQELFVGSGTICSSYDFKACLEVDQELINDVYVTRCTHYSYPSFVIDFDPAFTYNYSCGSAILMSYIPVFIYTYLIVGFCTPIFYCLLAMLPANYFHGAVLRGVDAVLRPQDLTRSESGDSKGVS
eukprot:gene25131-32779_t